MKKQKILILVPVILLLLSSTCKDTTNCCGELKTIEKKYSELEANNRDLTILLNNSVVSYDSLKYNYDNLNLSWGLLVGMYDSILKLPPDTFWRIPNCRLFYTSLDTVNGIPLYTGYDGIQYRLMQDSATLFNIKINWIDTTVAKYRVKDSLIFLDSIVTRSAGEVVLWSHIICNRNEVNDTCQTKLVLGHVLTGSINETENISFLIIDAISIGKDGVQFPDINLKVNGELQTVVHYDKGKYTRLIYLGYDEVESIELTADVSGPNETLLVKDVILNDLKLNHPYGWNVSVDDDVEYMGNTYFLLNPESVIRFEKR